MNGYCRLSQLNDDMANGSEEHNARVLRVIEAASRGIDGTTKRHFYALVNQTRYLVPSCAGTYLAPEFDTITVTTLKASRVSAGVYSYTLTADADYIAGPENRAPHTPIRWFELLTDGQLGGWPTGQRGIQIVGDFGWSYELEDTGVRVVGDHTAEVATIATSANVGGLSPGVTLGGIDPGETLVIGSEQLDALAVPTTGDLTVTRAINGSTASAITDGAIIYRRRYPRAIEQACAMETMRLLRGGNTGFSGQGGDATLGGAFSSTYPQIRDLLAPFKRVVFA